MPAAFLPIGLAFLMFVVGLRLTFADLGAVFVRPSALLTGLAVQMLFLPAAGVLLAWLFGLSPRMATGLVIVSVSPGGITSNYVAMLARADVALSAAMTLLTSILAAVSVPAALALAGALVDTQSLLSGSVSGIALAMALVSVLPLCIGIAFKRMLPGTAQKSGMTLDIVSKAVFAGIVISTFAENWDVMTRYAAEAGLACLTLNLAGMATAFAVSALLRLPGPKAAAIAIETGMQNAAVSMFIAANLFGDPALAIPALIYALAMNVTALLLIVWRNPGCMPLGRNA